MTKELRIVIVVALFAVWGMSVPRDVTAQNQLASSDLISKLQSDATSDQARDELLKLGKSEPDVRKFLAAQLPGIIAIGPKVNSETGPNRVPCCLAWSNAVELAGKLKIGETAPALGEWIDVRIGGPLAIGLGPELRFDTRPAAKALVEIGTPAIAVVQRVLYNGSTTQHEIAVRVLSIMNSREAKAVLRDYLPHEQNPRLRTEIERELNRK